MVRRVRQRPVGFGNPSLGTYRGVVYTLHDSEEGEGDDSVDIAEMTRISSHDDGVTSRGGDCLVAMVDVPPEEVPEGVLNFSRAHRPHIRHVRIVRSEKHASLPLAPSVLPPLSPAPPKPTHHQQHHQQHEHRTNSLSVSHAETAMENAASILAKDEDDLVLQAQEQQRVARQLLYQDNLRREKESMTYLVLLELDSSSSVDLFVRDLNGRPYTLLQEDVRCNCHRVVKWEGRDGCAVDLMSPGSSSKKWKEQNCAVCLETLGESAVLTTVCNHSFHLDCLLRWRDSPCPVCRYDHSGLNEALSRCHECLTTEKNHVCLICGVVSCGGEGGRGGHAREHYHNTLHAYALDIETQHVWDFAGDGFVHRLIRNADDGKLVEINDPLMISSYERSLSPGLSDTQQNEVVHRKLERAASQYYTLLKSQLEQQRIHYETRLEHIRSQYAQRTRPSGGHKSCYATEFITALKQDRSQIERRCFSQKKKLDKVSVDVEFLKSMNESLEANKNPMEMQIRQAEKDRQEVRDTLRNVLPPMQEKVRCLMMQLECGMDIFDDRKIPARKA